MKTNTLYNGQKTQGTIWALIPHGQLYTVNDSAGYLDARWETDY